MNFLKKLLDPLTEIKSEEEIKEREELGINDELIQFVEKIAKYPQPFQDFPLNTVPTEHAVLKLNNIKQRHVKKIITLVKPLDALRFSLCPSRMTDEQFWMIYFIHIAKVAPISFEDPINSNNNDDNNNNNNSNNEMESQLDKLYANQKMMMTFDEGIDEDEDSYFSNNIYVFSKIKEAIQRQSTDHYNNIQSITQKYNEYNSVNDPSTPDLEKLSPILQSGNHSSKNNSPISPNNTNNQKNNNNSTDNNSNTTSPTIKPPSTTNTTKNNIKSPSTPSKSTPNVVRTPSTPNQDFVNYMESINDTSMDAADINDNNLHDDIGL